jgi:hypothetical protein
VALALAAAAAFDLAPRALRVAALAAGSLAVALHLQLMLAALRTGMRRDLGRSFTLVRGAWALLVASLAAGLALTLDGRARLQTLFGLALVVGWLLTFLPVLQRIVPFGGDAWWRRAPRSVASALTASAAGDPLLLPLHGVALLALAVVADSVALAAFAAAIGAIGAAARAFLAITRRRLVQALAGARPLPAS